MQALAEDLGIGMKADRGAALVLRGAGLFQLRLRLAAAVFLRIELAVARDLDDEAVAQRIDDRNADAMQAARRLIRIAAEFAAGMQHGENDLERRGLGEFRMR